MAWTTPGTAVAGDVLTASFWNSNVRDNLNALAGQSFAKNLLYNGAMQISQRGTSTASISNAYAYYTADRWAVHNGTLGTWTQSIENDAPAGSGLSRSLKMLCTTADASPAAGDLLRIQQSLEGYDVQRIAKGTSSALPLTLSFWVKSNVTGTYIVELNDGDNTRSVSQSYTISSSATWEQKTLVFPADTTGVFNNDNDGSLTVLMHLADGSNFTSGTLQTSWGTTVNANRAVGQTNLASAINNYWQVTGVQLETGSAATGFEFLQFGDELRRCQRYYEKSYDQTSTPGSNVTYDTGVYHYLPAVPTNAYVSQRFKVSKRSSLPTISIWSASGTANRIDTAGGANQTFFGIQFISTEAFTLTTNSIGSAGNLGFMWTADAEL